ncbi:D-isomer specific 2-hydroxyacid dehydrogenase NAD-binding protein [Candidatus Moduliflexus flocculans]|uniref:D-isomer specific 2-hydroxyacid dehydrogenase NAD-binding protein n=1 Tax=Candidatus Moduliflexus flocculans TaxID=1499966 RepID=A0A081BSV0_9BACT|nr:D-isomer specific 2-hydroxyacid dehydrogenase NAD-binding protein [Candidatus Moduliflexus flocculans]
MSQKKILFYDAKPYDQASFEVANAAYRFDFKFLRSHLTEDTAVIAKGYDAICLFVNDHLTASIADILVENTISIVALRCAGYNNIDLHAAYKRLHVVRVPSYSPYAVAEHATALMLALNRKTHKAYYRTRDNNFTINGLMGFDMRGKTAGVIGTGQIGKVLMQILHGFGMTILAYDKFPDRAFAEQYGVRYVELDELYAESDIISLHCPLTKETYHLINEQTINKMKPTVMLINTGRGQLIDSKALVDALRDKRVGAAGLDVYEEESDYFFEDFSTEIVDDDVLARLISFPNVLLTSHQAYFTQEALSQIATTTLRNLQEYFDGKPLPNEICYQCGDTCRKKTEGRCF